MNPEVSRRGPVSGLFFFAASRSRRDNARAGLARGAGTLLIAALAASAVMPGAVRAAPGKLVLVSIDGLPAGAELQRERMPALAALAGSGVRCDDACSPAAVPFPAWVELLTGCGPGRTLVRDEFTRGLGERPPTLAASLGALGYRGLALPGDPLAHSASGLARGFERYMPDSPALADSARVDSALAWLRSPGRRFAWIGLSLGAPAEAWRRTDGIGPRDPAAFASRARDVDRALGRLVTALERAGIAPTTLIAVTGTGSVPGAGTRVPVVFHGPGAGTMRGGLENVGPAGLLDVAPTLVAAAGGSGAIFGGIDLLAHSPARLRPGGRPCPPAKGMTEADPLALPDSCAPALFARIDRGVPRPDSVELSGWDSLVTRCRGNARVALERDVALSRAGREQVAALGLKGAVAAMPGDPRPVIAYADHLLRADRNEIAPELLKSISTQNPYAAIAAWRLAIAYAGQQDFVAAEISARRAAAMASPTPAALAMPASLHDLGTRRDSTDRDPGDLGLHIRFGRALGDFGLFNAAYQQFHAARGLAPASAEPDYWLATYLERQGRPQHAVPTLERGLKLEPEYVPARLLLADALLELGRRHEAREQLERVRGSIGADARTWYNLACLRATEGEVPGALDALERAVAEGYAGWTVLGTDHDLDTLRAQPRFRALIQRRGR